MLDGSAVSLGGSNSSNQLEKSVPNSSAFPAAVSLNSNYNKLMFLSSNDGNRPM
jgi:hypothetical protein